MVAQKYYSRINVVFLLNVQLLSWDFSNILWFNFFVPIFEKLLMN